MVMPYHLHMPSYFLETFTEYPFGSACATTTSQNVRFIVGFERMGGSSNSTSISR